MSMRSEADELIAEKEKQEKLRAIGDKLVRMNPEERQAAVDVLGNLNIDTVEAMRLSRNYRW